MTWPDAVTHFFEIFGQRYATSRLFMLGVALLVGVLLWLWLNKTRMGLVIRAGVDDQSMVRALGINISVVFAVTFFVGAFLAGMGGAMGASFSGVAPGADGQWLLNSLVVVIIGGLGSITRRSGRIVAVRDGRRVLAGVPAHRLHLLLDHPDVRAARAGARGASERPVRAGRMSVLVRRGSPAARIAMVVIVVGPADRPADVRHRSSSSSS